MSQELEAMENKVALGRARGSVTVRFLSAVSNLPAVPPLRVVDERLVLCFGLALYLRILWTASNLLQDPDTLWHLKLGEVILATHHVPSRDLFSYTMAGAPYFDMQWLSQVLMSLAYWLGGFGGVVALTAFAAALAFALLYRELLRRLHDLAALALAGVAWVLCLSHLCSRPHILIAPILVLWTAWLIRSAEAKRAPPLALLPLMTIWANMHGTFLFGLALMIPFLVEAVLRAENHRLIIGRNWVCFAVLAVAATSISPYGTGQITAPLRVLDLGKAVNLILEMQPQDFSTFNTFGLLLLFCLGCALFSGVSIPATRIAVLLLLLHLALSHTRHQDLLGLVGPLVVAESIARRFPEHASLPSRMPWLYPVPFALCIAVLAQTALVLRDSTLRPSTAITPEAAFSAAKTAGLKGRLFNDFDFGGYLISIGVPTFIDGRAEFFGAERLKAFTNAIFTQDSGDLARFLDSNQIDWTLLEAKRPAAKVLDHLPGWQRIYGDADAVVHARRKTPSQ